MNVLSSCLARVRGLFQGSSSRLDEELEYHAELLAADYMKRGIPESEARSAASRELGNHTSVREQYREQNGIPWLETFFRDLKYAVRTFRRDPAFTASCLATLAVGSAGLITVLCVVSTFLWTPLPYPHQARLAALKEIDPRGGLWTFSEPAFLDLKERSRSLEAISACRNVTLALTGVGEPEAVKSAEVTPSFFAMFGILPVAGRAFQAERDSVVISPALWKRKWRQSPSIIGQAVKLEGKSYVVAGVAEPPRDLLPGIDLLLPLEPVAAASRTAHEMEAFARFRRGLSEKQVQAELSALGAQMAQEHPSNTAGWGVRAVPLFDYLIGQRTIRILWMILAGVVLLWLLTCANVTGLQLARRISRMQEMATRSALGASWQRLLSQSLTESALLAFAGALLGYGIADWAIHLLRLFAMNALPRLAFLHADPAVISITLAGLVVSALIFGILPARRSLTVGQRGTSKRDAGRDSLMVAQVALASVLTLGAGLLFQSFSSLCAVNPGFDPDRLLTAPLSPSIPGISDWQRVAFVRAVADRLKELPGVESVAATNVAPFTGYGTLNRFRLENEPQTNEYRSAAWRAITPDFFRVTNIPLKSGRLFTDADTSGAPEVLIVSESMARHLWPNQQPIGKRLLWGSSRSPKTIVGVVGDMRDLAVGSAPVPTMFRPFAQLSDAPMTALIRVKGDSPALLSSIRKAIWSVDPDVPVELRLLRTTMADSLFPERASLQLMAAFALIAMTIAASGLYGLISYRVSQRRLEIGIRLALGASASSVRWSVQRRCLALVCTGLALGLPVAFACSRFISSLLYEVGPTDLSSYAAVLVLFAAIALLASYPPASRAARLQPASIIRHE